MSIRRSCIVVWTLVCCLITDGVPAIASYTAPLKRADFFCSCALQVPTYASQLPERSASAHIKSGIIDHVLSFALELPFPKSYDLWSEVRKAGNVLNPIAKLNGVIFAGAVLVSTFRGNWGAIFAIDPYTIRQFGALTPSAMKEGEYWRLLTAGFMHVGLTHLFFNLSLLYVVGHYVHRVYSTSRFLLIYLIAIVAGFSLSSTGMLPTLSGTVGASGGLFGLVGALFVHGFVDRTREHDISRRLAFQTMAYGILTGLLPNVDNRAHIGGFIAGVLVGFALLRRAGSPRWIETFWPFVATIASAVTLSSIGKMVVGLIISATTAILGQNHAAFPLSATRPSTRTAA